MGSLSSAPQGIWPKPGIGGLLEAARGQGKGTERAGGRVVRKGRNQARAQFSAAKHKGQW